MNDPESRRGDPTRRKWWIGVLLMAAAALAGAVFWYGPWRMQRRGHSPEEVVAFYEKAHIAVGHLENLQLDQAEPLLDELHRKLPEEPIGTRNLAICRYLMFDEQRLGAEVVLAALDALRKSEPANPTAAWLRAKTAYRTNPEDLDLVVAAYEEAARLDPQNPLFPYEIYSVCSVSAEEQWKKQATDALRRAYELAPQNLFVLVDWMLVQAQEQNPALEDTLKQAMEVLRPLQTPILRRNNLDLGQLLDEAQQAVSAGDWPTVMRSVRVCSNVIRPHDFAQSDKRALTPHPLEFAAHELSAAFREQHALESPRPEAAFAISLAANSAFPAIREPSVRDAQLIDFDLDGQLDLALLTDRRLDLLRYDREAKKWDIAAKLELPRPAAGLLTADLDHDRHLRIEKPQQGQPAAEAASKACFDADPDFVVYGPGGVMIVRNDLNAESGQRILVNVPQEEALQRITGVHTARLVDFDHDSLLDVVAATDDGFLLLLAQGNLTYADVSEYSTLPEFSAPLTSLVAVDWDRDIDIDVLAVSPDSSTMGYLENLRHGDFRWRPLEGPFETLATAQRLVVCDADGNVSWDVIGAGPQGVRQVFTRTAVPGKVEPTTTAAVSSAASSGCVLADLDNDGYPDIVSWHERGIAVRRGGAAGQFADKAGLTLEAPSPLVGCEPGDLDQDGDLDLALVTGDGIAFLMNDGGNQNNWLAISAMGQVDNAGKANHNGLGSLLELKAGLLYQAQVVERPITHFGLGNRPRADIVRFLWTNGVPQAEIRPEANQFLCEPMTLKGSCPYLYTWTGARFEFFTDCLWAAPIGLQLAEGVLAPSRAWEYLQIPGDRLQKHEGRYTLQLTEELWESTYVDQMRLIAVDHPAEVEIYTNEKVGPAEIAEYKLHPVRKRRYPVAAQDARGRDVLETLTARDEKYLKAFEKVLAPGRVEEHFVELDLGPLESPKSITLFLTGWIYPTDTSTNVSLSRPARPGGPKPPSVQVLDGEGQWQTAQAFMGFPGGKTKTIAVDLSDAFLTDVYRLRIVTSAQIYWDEAFFTVEEGPADTRETVLALETADLHYRGFSRARPHRENAPETYDYAQVTHATKWAPMAGRFTRYGDVAELLGEADDCMVVMAAGDEMTVSFAAPATDPPDGWVRDFILHNVGWDKDADLNTVYGQSAEPLPFQAMESYADPAAGFYPESVQHQDYLRTYQTRIQEPLRFWRQIKQYRETAQ